MARHIIIVGAGVAGLTASIALSTELKRRNEPYRISVFESRTKEAIGEGGAISLTPLALFYFNSLGVLAELDSMGEMAGIEVDGISVLSLHNGHFLQPLKFGGGSNGHSGKHKGRRVLRKALFEAMLALALKDTQVSVEFEKRVGTVHEVPEAVILTFEDGSSARGNLLLGCDGVHSVVRSQLVDPGHLSDYSGVSFIQTLSTADRVGADPHFERSAIHLNRHGSFLATYCDKSRQSVFVAAVTHVNEFMVDKYRARALATKNDEALTAVQMALRHQVRSRFGKSTLPWIQEWIDKTFDWALYPVYQVKGCRKWYTAHTLLLGDAAHAMPPREESAAYAIEDSVLFAHIFANAVDRPSIESFQQYDNARREEIRKAFDSTRRLWQSDLDKGLFPGQYRNFISTAYHSLNAHAEQDGQAALLNRSISAPTYEGMSDLSVHSLLYDSAHSLESEKRWTGP